MHGSVTNGTCTMATSRAAAFQALQPTLPQEQAQEHNEHSLTCAIGNLLVNPAFSDVTLQGTNGETIHAHRTILAARSPVFERLLYGNFSGAVSGSVVHLGYDGIVLRSIVEYCYTDKISLLDKHQQQQAFQSSGGALAPTIVNVAAAADYFLLPELCKRITQWAMAQMDNNLSLAWPFLVDADRIGVIPELWNYSMNVIRAHFVMSLRGLSGRQLQQTLSLLTFSVLEKIVSDDEMTTDEISLFGMIEAWADCGNDSTDDGDNDAMSNTREKRRKLASILVQKHICLTRIPPSELGRTVAPSGLVPTKLLLEAFAAHAAARSATDDDDTTSSTTTTAEDNFSILPILQTKRGPCWESSNMTVYKCHAGRYCSELLRCRGLKSGRHMWGVQVVKRCDIVWLGVALVVPQTSPDRRSWLGKQTSGWVYGSNGAACHAAAGTTAAIVGGHEQHNENGNAHTGLPQEHHECVYPLFEEGSIIRFTFDLTNTTTTTTTGTNSNNSTKRGTLRASVGQSAEFLLFDDMRMPHQDENNEATATTTTPTPPPRVFVPAVSLRAPGAVRFLGFHPASYH